MSNRVILIMGVAGTGKSTVAKELSNLTNWPYIDADDLHSPAAKQKMHSGMPLNDQERAPWLNRVRDSLNAKLAVGPCILACSALKSAARDFIGNGLLNMTIVHLTGTRELLFDRINSRSGHFFPASLLDSQLAALEKPIGAIELDVALPLNVLIQEILKKI